MKYLNIIFFFLSFTGIAQNNQLINSNDNSTITLENIKQEVKDNIDAFAYDEDSNKRRYKVRFERNYMRLLIMKADGSKPINKGLLYDFSKVDRFDDISFRRKDIAYINIYVNFLDKENYPKRKKWVRIKLIMKVFGHDKAKTILSALKAYNDALTKEQDDKN